MLYYAHPTARGRVRIASGKRNWNQNLYSLQMLRQAGGLPQTASLHGLDLL